MPSPALSLPTGKATSQILRRHRLRTRHSGMIFRSRGVPELAGSTGPLPPGKLHVGTGSRATPFCYIEFLCPPTSFSVFFRGSRALQPRRRYRRFHESFPCINVAQRGGVFIACGWLCHHHFQLEFRWHGAEHHGAAGQRHGHSGTDGYFFRECQRDFTAELSVAKKRRKYQRSDRGQLHDAGHDEWR
jgi:hypothetical protein